MMIDKRVINLKKTMWRGRETDRVPLRGKARCTGRLWPSSIGARGGPMIWSWLAMPWTKALVAGPKAQKIFSRSSDIKPSPEAGGQL